LTNKNKFMLVLLPSQLLTAPKIDDALWMFTHLRTMLYIMKSWRMSGLSDVYNTKLKNISVALKESVGFVLRKVKSKKKKVRFLYFSI
jgi:hypothetical protein